MIVDRLIGIWIVASMASGNSQPQPLFSRPRHALTLEAEDTVRNKLADRYKEATSSSVPFEKYGITGNYDIYVSLNYGGEKDTITLVDSGCSVLIMSDFALLQKAQPDITVVSERVYEPWGHKAKLVRGDVSFRLSNSELRTLNNITFFACTESGCMDNLGMSLFPWGSGSVSSPLSQLRETALFNYQESTIELNPDKACEGGKWLGAVDGPGLSWTFVYVDELTIAREPTEWAQGTGGPPQYGGNVGTLGMLDTGGGPAFLSWGNIDGLPGLPAPAEPKDCPEGFWFSYIPVTDDSSGYQNCTCYFDDAIFTLEGYSPRDNVTFAAFEQSAIASVSEDTDLDPSDILTLLSCKIANLGGGDYVNLGGVMFDLYKITFDYTGSNRVCFSEY